jgi:Fe-S oxidoreductase
MNEIERVADECLECGLCEGVCEFLSEYCDNPREYAERILNGELVDLAEIAFYCNICGCCTSVCPEAMDLGKLFMQVRARAVEEGVKIPRNLQFLKKTQEYVNSDEFVLNLPNSEGAQCDQVLFPGCHLAGYSPDLVMSTYAWLKDHIPDLGIVLQCCGAPDLDTGNVDVFNETVEKLTETLDRLGVKEVIAACPNCLYHFKRFAPQIKVTSLYEVMTEYWPEKSLNGKGVFAVHDPCKARSEFLMQDAAKTLIERAGFEVAYPSESGEETRCCGQGGLVPYASMKFAGELSKNRAEQLGERVVTYCASCREAFAPYTSSVHLLDLLFNNQDLQETGQKAAHKPSEIQKHQAYLKERLLEVYGNGS